MREIAIITVAVTLTIIIEAIVLFVQKVRDIRLWISLPLNLFTNLILNCSLAFVRIQWLYYVLLVVAEGLVFLVEWGIYQLAKKDNKNWWYALSTNLISFLLGSPLVFLLFYVLLP